MPKGGLSRRLRSAVPLAVCILVLAGCGKSAENQLLQPSGLAMEDPKFFPSDNYLRMGKVNYRHGDYGLSEKNFRKAVEVTPNDAEGWLGLAASYDQLRRFELADQAYNRVIELRGKDAIVLNNLGYSLLLRGDSKRARSYFLKAYELDSDNPYIIHNLELMGETNKTIKRSNL